MFKQSVFSKEESNDSQSHILQFVTKFPSWKLEVFWKSVTLQDFFFHLKLANTSFVEHGSLDRNGLWHHRILQVFFWTLNKNKDEQKYTWYTPWKSSDQTSRMVFSMIHIKDSRSYQVGKPFGLPWDSPGKCFQLFGGVILCRPLPREIIGTIGALEPSWVGITNDIIMMFIVKFVEKCWWFSWFWWSWWWVVDMCRMFTQCLLLFVLMVFDDDDDDDVDNRHGKTWLKISHLRSPNTTSSQKVCLAVWESPPNCRSNSGLVRFSQNSQKWF